MAAANVQLQMLDKGLRSTRNAEKLAAIATIVKTIEIHPYPLFVNNMLLRLVDAFRDGTNDVRMAIARSLGQVGPHMKLAYSTTEIIGRIMTVSHSNDPLAREATLEALSNLAPLAETNGQVHHLICESMSTEDDDEFRAACAAMKAFAKLSSSFAASVISQLTKMLEDSYLPESRRIELCSVLSTMSANAQTMEQVFALSDDLLSNSPTITFLSAFLDAMTSLCIKVRYAIPRQIDILLSMLPPTPASKNVKAAPSTSASKAVKTPKMTADADLVLRELSRLAVYASIWSDKQIETLLACLQPSMSVVAVHRFLDAAIALSANCSHSNIGMLRELVASTVAYGSTKEADTCVRYIHLAANVCCTPKVFEQVDEEEFNATMTSLAVVIVAAVEGAEGMTHPLSHLLYRSIGDILCTFKCSEHEFCTMIIGSIFAGFTASESGGYTGENLKERLEMFCRLADTHKQYIEVMHHWALRVFRTQKALFDQFPQLFSYLLLGIGINLGAAKMPAILFAPGCASDLTVSRLRYETAKAALRNGHWIDVAWPNLNLIPTLNMTKPEGQWVNALRELASSQLLEFKMETLERQQKKLRTAHSIYRSALQTPHMVFPTQMTGCMLLTSEVMTQLFTGYYMFRTYLSAPLVPGEFYNPITARRLVVALSYVEKPLLEVQALWSALCRASFCADPTSLDLITLYYSKVTILIAALRIMTGKETTDTVIQLPPLTTKRTSTQKQYEKLQWAIDQFPKLRYENLPVNTHLEAFHAICEELTLTPYMLPRFFFQQFYNIEFKLSMIPVPEYNTNDLVVSAGSSVPIRIDGTVESTHPSHIRQIIVYADMCMWGNQAHNFTMTETCEPNEENHFTAQFLIIFKHSCDVKVRIEFVDSTRRKQWKAAATLSLGVMVREVAQAGASSGAGSVIRKA